MVKGRGRQSQSAPPGVSVRLSPSLLWCVCVCEKYANVKYLPGVVAVAPQIKR